MQPPVRYARTDDGVHIAYQTVGDGPIDIVFVHAFVTHLEIFWELPSYARFLRELGAGARVIVFDKRGTGLSDRLSGIPTLEARMDDLRAVLDATGSERPLLFGDADGGALAALFAATYPERTLGLALWGGGTRMAWSPEYPWGMSSTSFEERLAQRMALWGDPDRAEETTRMTFTATGSRLATDPSFAQWVVRLQRYSVAPGDLERFSRVWFSTDATSALTAIQVPTIVFEKKGWPSDAIDESMWTATQIPDAARVSIDGDEDDPYLGDVTAVVREIERFASSIREEEQVFERTLATVLFTDIVSSTDLAVSTGDRQWKQLVEQHHAKTRALIGRFRGKEMDTAGDGFFATFDGPGRAVRCAHAITRSMEAMGLQVRAGVHTGEVEMIDGKAGGLTVVVGARIGSLAAGSEVLVSQTVKELSAGSGLQFQDRGEQELKGIPGRWRVFRVPDSRSELRDL